MNVDRQRAKEYSRKKERLAVAGLALGVATSVGFVASGLAGKVAGKLITSRKPGARERLTYETALFTASWLTSLPLRYYNGYIVEKQYGFSRQSPTDWARDQIKAETLSLALGVPLVEALYWTVRRWPRRWWLVTSAATIPLTAVLAQLFPVLIAPRFNRYEPLQDRALAARLKELAARSGINVADVYQMDMSRRTSKANAFYAGLGSTKRIVLADTMLDTFSPDEIEAIVAHETGHQAHRDIWRFVGLSAIYTLLTAALVNLLGRRLLVRYGDRVGTRELSDVRSLPAAELMFALSGLVISPLQLAYSRHIERRADSYAVRLTGDPAPFISSMEKLSESNLADPDPPRLSVLLLHSHPPIAERIERAGAVGRS